MSRYADYLPELCTMPLFLGFKDGEILAFLDRMQPAICHDRLDLKQAREAHPGQDTPFRVLLRGGSVHELTQSPFPFAMPAFGTPGVLMAEIPSFSRLLDHVRPQGGPPGGHRQGSEAPIPESLEFTPDSITRFHDSETAPLQARMLRNLLGMLAQKVCDVRRELFLLRDGRDLYEGLAIPGPSSPGSSRA
nr:hypothetical protein [uncultured Holophaga sp.]